MTALGSLISPMTLISDTVFPEPDSPTTPRISRSPTRKEILSTARTGPRSVRKETERLRTSSRAGFSWLGNAHPGIEDGIEDVNQRIGGDHEERGVDHGCQDHRQIETLQGVIGQ